LWLLPLPHPFETDWNVQDLGTSVRIFWAGKEVIWKLPAYQNNWRIGKTERDSTIMRGQQTKNILEWFREKGIPAYLRTRFPILFCDENPVRIGWEWIED